MYCTPGLLLVVPPRSSTSTSSSTTPHHPNPTHNDFTNILLPPHFVTAACGWRPPPPPPPPGAGGGGRGGQRAPPPARTVGGVVGNSTPTQDSPIFVKPPFWASTGHNEFDRSGGPNPLWVRASLTPAPPTGSLMFAMARAINAWTAQNSLLVSSTFTSGKAMAADLFIQTQVEKCDRVDRKRVLLFGSFGLFYQGMFQYWMYNKLFERLFPGTGVKNVIKKVAITNLFCDPVLFFPTFYTFREMLDRGHFEASCVTDGLTAYSRNITEDVRNSWAIWVPAHAVTYGIIPTHFRMPWIACVSFGYVGLLSYTRGSYEAFDSTCPETLTQLEDGGKASTRR